LLPEKEVAELQRTTKGSEDKGRRKASPLKG
jgi:hypothetical protein